MPDLGQQAYQFLFNGGRTLGAIVIVIVVAMIALRVWHGTVRRIVARVQAQSENLPRERQLKVQTLAAVIRTTGAIALTFMAALLVLNQFIEIGPLIAGAGVVGIAIGLGAQSLIRDIINGFFILLEDHFGVGDVIKINDQYAGFVEHLDLRRTVLRNLEGALITVPNGEIKVVANLTKDWSRMVVDLGVAYKEDTDRVIQVLEGVSDELLADETLGPVILERPEIVGVEALAESQVTIRILLKTAPMQQWAVGRKYRALVKKAFDRESIEIPFPHRTVYTHADAASSNGSLDKIGGNRPGETGARL